MSQKYVTRFLMSVLCLGLIATAFAGGFAAGQHQTPTACTAAMDWADAAVRVAGQAWIDGTEPTDYDHHAAQQYAAAQECRNQ